MVEELLERLGEAYEKLIHDVIQGESHNFVRKDELEQAESGVARGYSCYRGGGESPTVCKLPHL